MKRFTTYIAAIAMIGVAMLETGCWAEPFCERATGDYVEEVLILDSISAIDLSISANIFITQGTNRKSR